VKLCCPACGSVFSLDALLASESAREAVMAALALPAPLGKLLIQYIALFRPAQRQLSFDRVARLLEELRGPITDAKIERNGRIWPAPQDTWRMAITEMLALRDAQKLRLPLASHGYLFEIIGSTADRLQNTAELSKEARLRGETPVGGIRSNSPRSLAGEGLGEREVQPPKPAMPPEPEKRTCTPQHFTDLVKKLGIPTTKKDSSDDTTDPA
jgi:hypothetical protein